MTASQAHPDPHVAAVLQGTSEPRPGSASRSLDGGGLERLATLAFYGSVIASLALIVLRVLTRFDIGTLYDDAHIFQRYAYNALHGDGLAWNPGGAPAYGLTSLFFLVVAIPARLAVGESSALAALLSSALMGVAFVALAFQLVRASTRGAPPLVARCLLLVALYCLATSPTPEHFASGMDTTFALAFVTLYLLASQGLEAGGSRRAAVTVGVLGGLAFGVRPELLCFTILVPLATAVLGGDPAQRRHGRVALAITAAMLALHVGLAQLYFGSPLPLPFYAKSLDLYGPSFQSTYRGGSTQELFSFLAGYWPLITLVGLDALLGLRRFAAASTPVEKGALVATITGMSYALFVVVPVMGFAARFYHPFLPGLLFLAARAAARLARTTALHEGGSGPMRLVGLAAFLAFWLAPSLVQSSKDCADAFFHRRNMHVDEAVFARTSGPQKLWYRLEQFSALPDDLVIATTEVGLPGALSPRREVIDLAGLNETAFAHQRFAAKLLFASHEPDLIYMPHPHYKEMLGELTSSDELLGYDVFTAGLLSTMSGVAVRRTSPHYAAMRRILGNRAPIPPEKYRGG